MIENPNLSKFRCAVLWFCTNSSEQISAFVNSDETAVEGISFDALEQSLNGVELSYNSSDEEIGRVCSLIEGTFIYETKGRSLRMSA